MSHCVTGEFDPKTSEKTPGRFSAMMRMTSSQAFPASGALACSTEIHYGVMTCYDL